MGALAAGQLNIAPFPFPELSAQKYRPALILADATHPCGHRSSTRQRGFTLVELVTIIVILGILAAAAAPRFFDRNVFDSRGFNDQVIATLRHAQKTAIAQRRFVCASFSAVGVTPGSVTLQIGVDNSCPAPMVSPSGQTPYTISNNNASFSAIPAGGAISFDCLGRPRSVVGGATCNDLIGILTASTPITVNNYLPSISVERETGYVH